MVTNFIHNLTIPKQKYRPILYVKSNYVKGYYGNGKHQTRGVRVTRLQDGE